MCLSSQESCPREQRARFLIERLYACIGGASPCGNHKIESGRYVRKFPAQHLTKPAFHAISDHRATDTATHRESDARPSRFDLSDVPQRQQPARDTLALGAHTLEVAR